MSYSLQDRVSLGVSDYNAVFAGAQLMFPTGKLDIGVEGSLEAFIGDPKNAADAKLQEGSLMLRGGLVAGFHINDNWSAVAFLEGAKVPGILIAQVNAGSIPILRTSR